MPTQTLPVPLADVVRLVCAVSTSALLLGGLLAASPAHSRALVFMAVLANTALCTLLVWYVQQTQRLRVAIASLSRREPSPRASGAAPAGVGERSEAHVRLQPVWKGAEPVIIAPLAPQLEPEEAEPSVLTDALLTELSELELQSKDTVRLPRIITPPPLPTVPLGPPSAWKDTIIASPEAKRRSSRPPEGKR